MAQSIVERVDIAAASFGITKVQACKKLGIGKDRYYKAKNGVEVKMHSGEVAPKRPMSARRTPTQRLTVIFGSPAEVAAVLRGL